MEVKKASRKQIDFITTLLLNSNETAKAKAEFLTSKGLPMLSSKEANYCINILKKYNDETTAAQQKTVQKEVVKNDHLLEVGDILQDKYESYLVIKTTRKTVTVRPIYIDRYQYVIEEPTTRNCFHKEEFTKKVQCYSSNPTKKSYFIEPLGTYSMSPSAYFIGTKEEILNQLQEEKAKKEKEQQEWHDEMNKKVEAQKLREQGKEGKTLEEYYGIKDIKHYEEENAPIKKVKFAQVNKQNDVDEFNKDLETYGAHYENCIILKSFTITNNNLLYDLMNDLPNIWEQIGGSTIKKGAYSLTYAVEVTYQRHKYYINTETYQYARYFGVFESDSSLEEIYKTQDFKNHYFKKAIDNAKMLIEQISNNPNTKDHFIKLVLNDKHVQSIMNMYNYDETDRAEFSIELARYYDTLTINIYSNKENCTILDFGASYTN